MEVRTDLKNGPPVASPADTINTFQMETQARKAQWTQQLEDDPDRFADIEQQIEMKVEQIATVKCAIGCHDDKIEKMLDLGNMVE